MNSTACTHEKFANVVRALRALATGDFAVGQTRNFLITLLDDGQVQDRHVSLHDAATHSLALALALAANPVAAVALDHQELDTMVYHDTLLHREALLIVTTGNLENVPLVLISKRSAIDLVRNALVVESTTAHTGYQTILKSTRHQTHY